MSATRNTGKESMYYLSHYEFPSGTMTMASGSEHLIDLWFGGQKYDRLMINDDTILRPHLPVLTQTAQWLDAYFESTNPGFIPPIRVEGSDFKTMATSIMLSIPFDATSAYARIAVKVARRTGRTHMSARAVDDAVGHSPAILVVPYHRALAFDGSLRGRASGIDRKEWLLRREGVNVSDLSTPPSTDDDDGRPE